MDVKRLETDILIIGGGTAGCYAALTAVGMSPDIHILVAEKANIRRSGCLAAGVNAINAYITKGESPESYTEFVRWDAAGIIRDNLVLTMAQGFNAAVGRLEQLGLTILKDENGEYVARGKQNIKINGENIKVILADAVKQQKNVDIINHINITDYLPGRDGRVVGAAGFDVNTETAYFIHSRAVICATGGAAGLYRPNNPGFSRHKIWYSPFNAGAGYAMGIRAGAEMTSFEMRFVAQRCKDTIAPTGTIALGVGAKEVNARREVFEDKYGLTTSGRAYGVTNETHEGRGPCYLQTVGITPEQDQDLLRAYLNMAPGQTLKWLESGRMPSEQNVEVEGTEPYIVGGHTGSGYWVDTARRTTIPGLYAAGDVAGGAPKKFVTGALTEGEIAVRTALADMVNLPLSPVDDRRETAILAEYEAHLSRDGGTGPYTLVQLEEAMQKVMDNYAGGIGPGYRYNEGQLLLAAEKIENLSALAKELKAADTDELMGVYELKDRLTVCRVLIAHMSARKETRWPGFGINTDYPEPEETWAGKVVNSRLERGKLRVFCRELEKGGLYFAETLGNPSLDVTDILPLADLAHRNGVPLIVDNTAATAFLVKPLSLGADIVVNSSSKYINGNSNSISGVLTDGGKFKWDVEKYPGMASFMKFGPFAYTAKLRNGLFRNTGACLSPQNAFYNCLGMETLGLRMERICDNALRLAEFFWESYPEMTVNYPGLETSPWHEIADRQFSGRYGGMITLRTGSRESAFAIINTLKIPLNVSNIGDTKTLVIHPESTISVHSTEREKKDAGVFEDLIRISVGIEDIEDLIADFAQAIEKAKEA